MVFEQGYLLMMLPTHCLPLRVIIIRCLYALMILYFCTASPNSHYWAKVASTRGNSCMSHHRGKNHVHCRHLNTPDGKIYLIQDPYELLSPIPLSTRHWPWCGTCVCLDNSNSDARTDSPPQGSNGGDSPETRSPPSVQVGGISQTSRSVSRVPGQPHPVKDSPMISLAWRKTGNVSSVNGSA